MQHEVSWSSLPSLSPLRSRSLHSTSAVPLGFPSHQGLIAPLWRIWPVHFSVLALWVGTVVPDVVDGFLSIAIRGHFQQWIGHSLVGATAVGVPVGLVLTLAVRLSTRRLANMPHAGRFRNTVQRVATWLRAVDKSTRARSFSQRVGSDALSVWIGALSHVFFDLLSHEQSRLLWPFSSDPAWLGAWWRTAWFHVSAPGYPDYPIGPHFVGWLVLSLAGAVMFFRWPPRAHDC